MMFTVARRLAVSSNAVPHSANAARNGSRRFMSVISFSDDESVLLTQPKQGDCSDGILSPEQGRVDSLDVNVNVNVDVDVDVDVDASVVPSDPVVSSPAANPAKRHANAAANPFSNVADTSTNVPPPTTMPPYDRVPNYNKKTGKLNHYIHVPEDCITDAQIREYVTQNKKCSKCGKTKDSSSFYIARKNKDGLENICRACTMIRIRKMNYGITDLHYRQLRAKQNEKCAICDKDFLVCAPKGNIHGRVIDHDHDTGQIRGLLCGSCNRGLGHFEDSTKLLKAAIFYLIEHKQRGKCVTETLVDANVGGNVVPSDPILSLGTALAKRLASAAAKLFSDVAHAAAKVPPPTTMPPYDRVPKYRKTGKSHYYIHFPKNCITDAQIREYVTQNKSCSKCGKTKNSSSFHINRTHKDGLLNKCGACTMIRYRKRQYGITDLQYRQLRAKQNDKCAICDKDFLVCAPKGRRHGRAIDHDHDTKQIRGLLCGSCNRGLGHFGDSTTKYLKAAILYLTQHEHRGTCVTKTLQSSK
jgi:hypothetical protein